MVGPAARTAAEDSRGARVEKRYLFRQKQNGRLSWRRSECSAPAGAGRTPNGARAPGGSICIWQPERARVARLPPPPTRWRPTLARSRSWLRCRPWTTSGGTSDSDARDGAAGRRPPSASQRGRRRRPVDRSGAGVHAALSSSWSSTASVTLGPSARRAPPRPPLPRAVREGGPALGGPRRAPRTPHLLELRHAHVDPGDTSTVTRRARPRATVGGRRRRPVDRHGGHDALADRLGKGDPTRWPHHSPHDNRAAGAPAAATTAVAATATAGTGPPQWRRTAAPALLALRYEKPSGGSRFTPAAAQRGGEERRTRADGHPSGRPAQARGGSSRAARWRRPAATSCATR